MKCFKIQFRYRLRNITINLLQTICSVDEKKKSKQTLILLKKRSVVLIYVVDHFTKCFIVQFLDKNTHMYATFMVH